MKKLKVWKDNNSEKIKQYQKEYQQINKEKIKDKKKDYRINNKEKLLNILKNIIMKIMIKLIITQHNKYQKIKREIDPNYKLIQNSRNRTYYAFKAQNVKITNKTMDLLGCSHSFLKTVD